MGWIGHSGASIARCLLAIGAGCVSLLNGLATSPLFDSVMFYLAPMVPGVLRQGDLLFYFNGVFAAMATFLLAGVPARIFERMSGRLGGSMASHAIWLVAAMLLSIPGGLGAIGYFDIE